MIYEKIEIREGGGTWDKILSKPSFIRISFRPIKVCEANNLFYIKIYLLEIKRKVIIMIMVMMTKIIKGVDPLIKKYFWKT